MQGTFPWLHLPFLGSKVHQDHFAHLFRRALHPFLFLHKASSSTAVPKASKGSTESAVPVELTCAFLMALGDSAAVWAKCQCGVPGRPGH